MRMRWLANLWSPFVDGTARPLTLNPARKRGSDRNKYAPSSGRRTQAAIATALADHARKKESQR